MKYFFLLFLGLLLGAGRAHAQDFVYEPKNPSFGGGNTFNYSWLLSSAQSQNKIEDPSASRNNQNTDPLSEFQNNLNRQILSLLTTRFVNSQFGNGGEIREGSYNIGSYQIQVTPSGSGVSILITDTTTGGQTTVTIPNTP